MKRTAYASKGWKALQADYIKRDLHALHVQKLHSRLSKDISGVSLEEAAIHYGFLSHSAICIPAARYMQTGVLEHAESYFCLSTLAKQTSCGLLAHNPRWESERTSKLQMPDSITAAVLCGLTPAALNLLAFDRMALEREKTPMWNGRPDTRIDRKQEERRKRRRALEIGLFESLLRQEDEPARRTLAELDSLRYTPSASQTIHALLDQDGPRFADAAALHMREFRQGPDAGEWNDFVLLMEFLYQKRDAYQPPDLADAPAALLSLPECAPSRLEERLGVPLPSFDVEALLPVLDLSKAGPNFQQY